MKNIEDKLMEAQDEAAAIVVNAKLAADISYDGRFKSNGKLPSRKAEEGKVYCIGTMLGVEIYVDPFKRWNDTKVEIRKGL